MLPARRPSVYSEPGFTHRVRPIDSVAFDSCTCPWSPSSGCARSSQSRTAADLDAAATFDGVADWLLFDGKPPKTMANALPGGNRISFDWILLKGRRFKRPWLLAGGLDAGNLAEAVRQSGAMAVDVSSGVEERPGVKDPKRIQAFLHAARAL